MSLMRFDTNLFYQVSSTTDEGFQEQKVNSAEKLTTALNVLQYEAVRRPSHHVSQHTNKACTGPQLRHHG